MHQGAIKGKAAYWVRISRQDGKVVKETPFTDIEQALLHFHEMVRSAPQPNVYVQLYQHTSEEELEVLETGFYYGPSPT